MTIYDYVTTAKFNEFIDNICKDDKHRENLRSFIVEIILTKADYYQKALDDKWIDWVVLRIIKNQWSSSTSPYFRQFRNENSYQIDNYHIESNYIDEEGIAELEQKDKEEEMLIKAVKSLPPHLEVLISFWFGLGSYEKLSIRKIAKRTGINANTVYAHLKKAKEMIKENYLKIIEE